MITLRNESFDADDFDFGSLRNADELRDEFIEILKQFDKDLNEYQTDVYLYVDENNNGEWYLFVNVGGNSWLDDDHITVYSDKPHYNDIFDYFDDERYIADVLGMSLSDLIAEVYASVDQDWYDIDDIGYGEIIDYIKSNDVYFDKLQDEYNRVIDDELNSEYADQADHILYGY